MSALEAELREMIASEGPIGIGRYMQICLQHPRHGYYTTRTAIGRDGDFITAPEVDQMFGELLGLWAAQVWIDMGSPDGLRLVELGPGRGTLMADALRATRIVPGFHQAIGVDLVETSPRLQVLQRRRLEGATAHIAWHQTIDEVPPGPMVCIANEFFDALPVCHYWSGATGWHERVIGLDADGRLTFGIAPDPLDLGIAGGAPGQILEIGHAAAQVAAHIAGRLTRQGGAMLVCDYGHATTSLGETLQAVRGHAYADVLRDPGEADLTAHVDFAALRRAAESVGAAAWGPVDQGAFLTRLGIVERATALKRGADSTQTQAIDAALSRFTARGSTMATLFKVLAVTPVGAAPPPGFEEIP